MFQTQRFEKILEILKEKEVVDTKTLAQTLNVSETTIRRDCEILEQDHQLIRIHGGAKSIHQKSILSSRDELAMSDRLQMNHLKKEVICKKAATLIKDGDCIFLDGGTTIFYLMRYLQNKKIKIVTHNQLILTEVKEGFLPEIIIVGGQYLAKYNMSVGPKAIEGLAQYNFDHAFFGCTGISFENNCMYTAELETLFVKEIAIKKSLKNHLLVDSSKYEVRGFCELSKLDIFHSIICNNHPKFEGLELPNNIVLIDDL